MQGRNRPGRFPEPIYSWSLYFLDTILLLSFSRNFLQKPHCECQHNFLGSWFFRTKGWLPWLILSLFSKRQVCESFLKSYYSIVHPESRELSPSHKKANFGTPSMANWQRQLRSHHPSHPQNHQVSQHETPHCETSSLKPQCISTKACGWSRLFWDVPQRGFFDKENDSRKHRLRVDRFYNCVLLFLSCGFCEMVNLLIPMAGHKNKIGFCTESFLLRG